MCLAAFWACFTVSATVVINEVQSSNDQTPVVDVHGEAMDWVELYNSGDAAVDLGGWGLSDNGEKKPFKWTFPAGVSIPAHGHLVVICDKVATSKEHPVATFGLGADGETLTLTQSDGTTADTMTFGFIPCDCSFGRVGDGNAELKWFAKPTPGAANNEQAYEAPLGRVAFSQERGVFTGSTSFTVALSYAGEEEGVEIRYTTDHGDPTASSQKYAEPIPVSKTTIIRATAVKAGHLPYRNITTHSYIYLDQVVNQTKPSIAPDSWSDIAKTAEDSWIEGGRKSDPAQLSQASCSASYTVSTKSVLTSTTAKAQFVEALKTAPVVSVTMSDADLFDPGNGIYCKPVLLDGKPEGTRAASVEWVTGNHVFCTDAGLSAHGDASRHFDFSPKKSFGLKFRGRFGASKLEVPVMDDIGCDQAEFKSLVLRAESNHSWTHTDDPAKGTYMHDQFLRDTFGAMTGFQSHGNQVHLFLNGLYWGLYNLCEAMDDHFAAAHWGGENEEYDILSGNRYEDSGFEVNDGDGADFIALCSDLKARSAQVKAKSLDEKSFYEWACGEIDIDRFIDYMIIEWYSDNEDWPQKNWKAMMSKSRQVPLTYFAWDLDRTFITVSANRVTVDPVSSYPKATNSVQCLQRALEVSAEYKLRFADRVHRHFFNDGALVTETMIARFRKMAGRIRPMVFAEAARWGAYRKDYESKTLYGLTTWDAETNRLTKTDGFLSQRWGYLKTHLTNQGLYPSVEAAEIAKTDETHATISIPTGATVYYTTDGSDPREAYTGAAKGMAYKSGETIAAPIRGATVRARALKGGVWSALSEAELASTRPPVNTFMQDGNGFNWDEDANWSDGYYPNAPGEKAAIGVPNAVKSKKNWRNIHINSNDVTVGFVEVTNGGWTNRVDTGDFGGNLVFDGGTNASGKAVNATFIVTDEANAGLAMIDLTPPNVVRLATDTTFCVSNTVGDANYGGLLLEGAWDGNGKNLEKTGPGRLTIAFTNATALGNLQCSEGVVAIETPISVRGITKKTGTVWVKMGGTNLESAVERVIDGGEKVNPNLCLFVPTPGGETWYGGIVADELKPQSTNVYVLSKSGDVLFGGERWKLCSNAAVEAVDSGAGGLTFRVTVPPPPRIKVFINEVQSSNGLTCKDEDYDENSDWIELYNGEDRDVDIGGWGLSDKKDKPFKWTFPSNTVIRAGDYLRVFADGQGTTEPLPDEPETPEEPEVDWLSPDDVTLKSSLVSWYCADDLTGSDGASVTSWADKSDKKNTATGTTGYCPVLKKNVVNGHATLQFTSSSNKAYQRLSLTHSGLTSMADVTVIIVGNWNGELSGGSSKYYAGLFDVSHKGVSSGFTTTRYDTYFQIFNSSTRNITTGDLQFQSGSATSTTGSKATKNAWAVYAFTTQSAGLSSPAAAIYCNESRTSASVNNLAKTAFADGSVMFLGQTQHQLKTNGSVSSQGYGFNGSIAEVIIYNRALTADEYAKVYRYIDGKYAISGTGTGQSTEPVKPAVKKNLHTSYSLSADGETLVLTDAEAVAVDTLDFKTIPCDASFGRLPDGGETLKWFADPTPGAANVETGYDEPLGGVAFTPERGLCTSAVNVKLFYPSPEKPDPETTIYYTTDHSEPGVFTDDSGVVRTNGTVYAGEEIAVSRTTVIRATPMKAGHLPYRNVTTHSYIFLSQVVDQVKPVCAGDKWTDDHYCSYEKTKVTGDKAACPAEYGISKSIVKTDADRQKLVAALSAAPVLNITMSDEDLFDPETGMHSHPVSLDEDRFAAVEWVSGNHVFGTTAGICMNGGWARQFEITPKKSFRIKFRGRFGASKLEVPVMDDVGYDCSEFKTLVLRGENNQSWGRYSKKGTSMADQVLRDVQGEMSGFESHGTHVHLFLNGLYWGLYNLCEHGDADFAAGVWGGEDYDWDVVKHDDGSPEDKSDGVERLDVRDGSAAEFMAFVDDLTAKAKDGTLSAEEYREVSKKIDIDAFIDYYILECYIGNNDWPENNWIACMSEKQGQPIRYIAWDVEYALHQLSMNRLTSTTAYPYTADKIQTSLLKSSEYKLRFADRVHKHFFNGGALMTASLQARYAARADWIRKLIYGEVARWGAYYYDHSKNGLGTWSFDVHYQDINDGYKTIFNETTWENEYTSVMNFFRDRWGNFSGYLSAAGLYTAAQSATAEFNTNGVGALSVTLSVPTGATVYYTTDGSDPREAFTGTAVGKTYTAGQVITVEGTATVKARALKSGSWSALSEIELVKKETRNVFVETGKDATWTKDSSWSLGYCPNAVGAIAVIGAPSAEDVSKKGQRKVTIGNGDGVTVGQMELTNGDYTNRIESVVKEKDGWFGGDLRLCGVETLNADGEAETNATIAVLDADGAIGQAVISLDPPWTVRLDSDLIVFVTNTAASGGLRIEGAFAGNGHDFKKSGPGRLTLACTNAVAADGSVSCLGKLQCDEGLVAVETPLVVNEITKKGGTIWAQMLASEPAAVLQSSLVSKSTYNDKLAIGLFVPTEFGSDDRKWYGGVVANNLLTKNVTVYVPNATGDVVFAGLNWVVRPDAKVETSEIVLDDGTTPSLTYEVTVPYFGPKVTVEIAGNCATNVYDGEVHSVSGCTVKSISTNLYGEADFTFTGTAATNGTNAGTYPMRLAAEQFKNINDRFEGVTFLVTDGELVITQAENAWTVEPAIDGWTYGETAKTPVGTAKFGEVTFAYSPTPVGAAGDYTMTATVAGTGNYTGLSKTIPFTIAKAAVPSGGGEEPGGGSASEGAVSKFDTVAMYDGEGWTIKTNELVAAFKAAFGGDVAVEYAYGGAGVPALPWMAVAPDFTNVCVTSVWYKVTSANYQDFTHEAKVTVTNRPVTLTSADGSFPYDGLAHSNTTVTAEGFVAGEGVRTNGFATITETGSLPNGFGYELVLNPGSVAENYLVTCVTGTLTVTQAENAWVVEPSVTSKTYDGKPAEYAVGKPRFGKVSVTFDGGDTPPVNAGVHTNKFAVEGTDDYGALSTNVEYEIRKAKYDMGGVTLEGETVTCDGKPHSLAISGELPQGVSVTYEGNDQTTAGAHVVTAKFTGDDNHEPIADMTATLVIEYVPYSVVYDPNGGIGMAATSNAVLNVGFPVGPNIFARTGYTFQNWTNATGAVYMPGAMVTNLTATAGGSVTLYATWEANVYTLVYKPGETEDEPIETNLVYDVEHIVLANPFAKDGYSFVSWTNAEGVAYLPGQAVTNLATSGTVVWTAAWTANIYQVTFDPANGTAAWTASVKCDAEVVAPDVPTRKGYAFAGWYADGEKVDFPMAMPAHDVSLTVRWTANAYTVAYDPNGGAGKMNPVDATYDVAFDVADCGFSKTGYTFAGWTTNLVVAAEFAPEMTISNLTATAGATVTLYATWEANTYTLVYKPGETEDEPIETNLVYDVEHVVLANPFAKDGYSFVSWTNAEGVAYLPGQAVTNLATSGTVVWTAAWTANVYTVTFDPANGTAAWTRFVKCDAEVVAPEVPTRKGYAFAGWFAKGAKVDFPLTMPAEDLTLMARWTANAYTVTYDPNGGAGEMDPLDATYGVAFGIADCDFAKTGYTFAGWTTNLVVAAEFAADDVVSNLTATAGATVTLYATWEANTYTLVYKPGETEDDPVETNLTYDVEHVVIANPFAKDGYSFVSWTNAEGVAYLPGQAVTNLATSGTVVWTAAWTANVYQVTFDPANGTAAWTQFVKCDAEVVAPEVPTRKGYAFAGWYADGEKVDFPLTMPAEDLTLTARWTANAYTVTYDPNGGEGKMDPLDATYDVAFDVADCGFAKEGYTFTGWTTNLVVAAEFAPEMTISNLTATAGATVTLYATWKANTYTLVYKPGETEDEPIETNLVYDVEHVVLANPFAKDGYSFVSWTNAEGVAYLPGQAVTNLATSGEVVWTAAWTANVYTVTFDPANGEAIWTASVKCDAEVVAPEVPTRKGYAFAGWFAKGAKVDFPLTMPAEDLTLTARWTANAYTVTYDPNGGAGEMDPLDATYDVAFGIADCDFAKTGYTFAGWTTNLVVAAEFTADDVVSNLTATAGATVTLYATWEANTYTLVYKPGETEDEPIETNLVYDVEHVVLANPFAKDGYSFVSWTNAEGVAYLPGQAVTNLATSGEVVWTAAWTANVYTVTFDPANGETEWTASVKCDAEVAAPEVPTRKGYAFAGWYADGEKVDFPLTMSAHDVFLTARWTANAYTVTYDPNGGAGEMDPLDATYDVAFDVASCGFSKTGYTFAGWTTNLVVAAEFAPEMTISNLTATAGATVTLYATWEANTYTLVYKPGETEDEPIETNLVYDVEHVVLANPFAKTGYSFVSWTNAEGVAYLPGQAVTNLATSGTVVWTAAWTANVYQVTFDPANGTAAWTQFVKCDAEVAAPEVPTRKGYAFAGWYADGEKVDFPMAMPAENLTLTARWTANAYTVAYDPNGGAGEMNPLDATYDVAFDIADCGFSKTGYTFAGWTTNLATEAEFAPEMTISNLTATAGATVTLYATWEANTYTLVYKPGETEDEPIETNLVYDVEHIVLANPFAKDGYSFVSWTNAEGVAYLPGQAVTNLATEGEVVWTAAWTANVYTVTFDPANGTAAWTASVKCDAEVVAPEVPTRKGYAFAGWFAKGAKVDFPMAMPAEDLTLTARWTANAYTVAYDPNGGEGKMDPLDATYDVAFDVADCGFSKEGYTFTGWTTNLVVSAEFTADDVVSNLTATAGATVTLYATWEANTYTLVYKPGETEDEPIETNLVYDVEHIVLANPFAKDGYSFVSWTNAEGVAYLPGQAVTNLATEGEVVWTAAWTANVYTVTFDPANGEAIWTASVKCDAEVVAPEVPTRKGYAFAGWFAKGAKVDFPMAMPAEDLTLTARWTANAYTVAYDPNGGEGKMDPLDATYDVAFDVADCGFSKEGYTFTGWTTNLVVSAEFTADDVVSNLTATAGATVTLYATWEANVYRITFDTKGGSEVADIVAKCDEAISAPTAPTKTGYTFDGWATNGVKVAEFPAKMPAGGLAMVAVWTANSWVVEPSVTDKAYDGTPAAFDPGKPKFGEVTVSWSGEAGVLALPPTDAGSYTAKFTVAETEDYGALEKVIDYTITKGANFPQDVIDGEPGPGSVPPGGLSKFDVVVTSGEGVAALDLVAISNAYATALGCEVTVVSTPVPQEAGEHVVTYTVTSPNYEGSISRKAKVTVDTSVPELYENVTPETLEEDPFVGNATYNGWTRGANGEITGLLVIKAAKANKRTGVSKLSVAYTPVGGKKTTIKFPRDYVMPVAGGNPEMTIPGIGTVVLANDTIVGVDCNVQMGKDLFKDKSTKPIATATVPQGTWTFALPSADGYAGFSVTVAKTGKAKVAGTMPDGTKVSVSVQGIFGDEGKFAIPVTYAKKAVSLSFVMWIDVSTHESGITDSANANWNGIEPGQAISLSDGPHIAQVKELDVSQGFTVAGKKWTFPKYSKNDPSLNPSSMKLTWTQKTGVVKGSLSVVDAAGKKQKFTVNGIVVDGAVLGTAFNKKIGAYAFETE